MGIFPNFSGWKFQKIFEKCPASLTIGAKKIPHPFVQVKTPPVLVPPKPKWPSVVKVGLHSHLLPATPAEGFDPQQISKGRNPLHQQKWHQHVLFNKMEFLTSKIQKMQENKFDLLTWIKAKRLRSYDQVLQVSTISEWFFSCAPTCSFI